jgi:hypothetical protein
VYETTFIEVNGAAIRYALSGNGPQTLVLFHELGGSRPAEIAYDG